MKLLMRYKGVGAGNLRRGAFCYVEIVDVDSKTFSVTISNNDIPVKILRSYSSAEGFYSEWERVI